MPVGRTFHGLASWYGGHFDGRRTASGEVYEVAEVGYNQLRQVKAEHLGVVLNAVRSQGGGYYGRNIKTYYAYQNA